MIIIHRGHPVEVKADPGVDIHEAINTSMFKSWLDTIDMDRLKVTSVRLMSMFGVDIGGGKRKNLFLMLDSESTANGQKCPGAVFASDPSVAALVVIKCGKKRYAVIVRQARTPIGSAAFAEIVAGMKEPNGTLKSNMRNEILQETGIDVSEGTLIDLSELAGHEHGFFPSPGRCSESIRCYALEIEKDREFIKSLKGRRTGVKEEHEDIRVDVVPLDALYQLPDGKTHVALGLYKRFVLGKRSKAKPKAPSC